MNGPGRFDAAVLEAAAARILMACGVCDEDARRTANCLLFSDLRGVDTHGLIRLKFYVDRLRAGGNNPRGRPRVLREGPTCALLEGDNALGPVAGTRGMELALQKAEACGIGAVAVRNGNHYGAAAYYAMMALPHDMIGISMTNTLGSMAPTGGTRAVVGNNPFCFAFPAGEEPPIVLDMATSMSSWGKLFVCAQEGTPLPEDCFLGPDGLPTTDAAAVMSGGFLLPIAGYKGYGLALTIAMLTGVLAGWNYDPDIIHPYKQLDAPGDNSYFMLAMKVDQFTPAAEFKARADEVARFIRATPPAPGVDRVWLPGEKELVTERERRERGIPLAAGTLREMRDLASELDVDIVF